jgi:aryl carrier-like protein
MHSNIMGETEADQILIQQHDLLQRLTQGTAIESQALLTTYIQEQVAQAIGISASQLDIQQPLNYMGIDSLIAVKLRNRLRPSWDEQKATLMDASDDDWLEGEI